MRKWAKFGAFHGCEASYIQIPLLHTTKRTALHSYTSGYAEAIAQWTISVSPRLQLTDLRNRLSNIKRKNFLAYHHFDPCVFEQLQKWGSVKKYSSKYRCEGQSFFGQDLFSHCSKRCCGLHTDECYLLPSDTKFERMIDGAIKERSEKQIDTTRPTMGENDGNNETTDEFNLVETNTSFDRDTNRAKENEATKEIMDVIDGLITLSQLEKEDTDYTVKKGLRISTKLIFVNLRQTWHHARRVLGGARWNMGTKEVLIQWDSNDLFEWINETQIQGEVNEEGKGKRDRKTVREATAALTDRLKQEHRLSQRNKKQKKLQKKLQKDVQPKVKKYVDAACKTYGQRHPDHDTAEWGLFASDVVDITDKNCCLSEFYRFVKETSGVWQTIANTVQRKIDKVKRYQ
jgi:hypothetical protein